MRSLDEAVIIEIEEPEPESGPRTLALVAGAFKPPTRGHLEMVREYAAMADEVKLIISNPLKGNRYIGDTAVTKEVSKAIWEIMLADAGLDNVVFHETDRASPVHAVFDFVAPEGPVAAGDTLILGTSTKGCDPKRWNSIIGNPAKYVKKDVNVECIPVRPAEHSEAYLARLSEFSELTDNLPSVKKKSANPSDIHASDLRYLAERVGEPGAWELLQDFFPPENADAILGHLGLQAPLEEVSGGGGAGGANSMSNGSIAGASGKVPGETDEETENNSIIREIMKLLKEKGIVL